MQEEPNSQAGHKRSNCRVSPDYASACRQAAHRGRSRSRAWDSVQGHDWRRGCARHRARGRGPDRENSKPTGRARVSKHAAAKQQKSHARRRSADELFCPPPTSTQPSISPKRTEAHSGDRQTTRLCPQPCSRRACKELPPPEPRPRACCGFSWPITHTQPQISTRPTNHYHDAGLCDRCWRRAKRTSSALRR